MRNPFQGSVLSIFQKAHPIEPLTEESLETAVKKAVEAARKATPEELNWRTELHELKMRFEGSGIRSVDETKANADSELGKHNGRVREIEDEIKALNKLLTTPYLQGSQIAGIKRKIEKFEGMLAEAKQIRETQIRVWGGRVRDAKTWAPHRARYEELKKREREIDAATARI